MNLIPGLDDQRVAFKVVSVPRHIQSEARDEGSTEDGEDNVGNVEQGPNGGSDIVQAILLDGLSQSLDETLFASAVDVQQELFC